MFKVLGFVFRVSCSKFKVMESKHCVLGFEKIVIRKW